MLNGEEIAYISRFVIQSKVSGTVISKDFKGACSRPSKTVRPSTPM